MADVQQPVSKPPQNGVASSGQILTKQSAGVSSSIAANQSPKTPPKKSYINPNFIYYLATALIYINFLVFLVHYFEMGNESSRFLQIFGRDQTTGPAARELTSQKNNLELEKTVLSTDKNRHLQKIENKDYYIYSQQINSIRNKNLQWSDLIGTDGKLSSIGIVNAARYIEGYFNESLLNHPILPNGNVIEIGGISVRNNTASFSITVSNLFGKVFYLSTELVGMINSLPVFKEGTLSNFSRITDKDGKDSMKFSLSVPLQLPHEEDSADTNDLLSWIHSSHDKGSTSRVPARTSVSQPTVQVSTPKASPVAAPKSLPKSSPSFSNTNP